MNNRPAGVPESLELEIERAVRSSWPCVVEPELAEAVQKNGGNVSNLIPLPRELIEGHIDNRRTSGASEEEIDEEGLYLLDFFEETVKRHQSRD